MRGLVEYSNALSLVVLAQAIRIEQMQCQLNNNADTMLRCRDTIEELTRALVGDHQTFTVEI